MASRNTLFVVLTDLHFVIPFAVLLVGIALLVFLH